MQELSCIRHNTKMEASTRVLPSGYRARYYTSKTWCGITPCWGCAMTGHGCGRVGVPSGLPPSTMHMERTAVSSRSTLYSPSLSMLSSSLVTWTRHEDTPGARTRGQTDTRVREHEDEQTSGRESQRGRTDTRPREKTWTPDLDRERTRGDDSVKLSLPRCCPPPASASRAHTEAVFQGWHGMAWYSEAAAQCGAVRCRRTAAAAAHVTAEECGGHVRHTWARRAHGLARV